jgi:hypothetical protein
LNQASFERVDKSLPDHDAPRAAQIKASFLKIERIIARKKWGEDDVDVMARMHGNMTATAFLKQAVAATAAAATATAATATAAAAAVAKAATGPPAKPDPAQEECSCGRVGDGWCEIKILPALPR